MPCEVKRYGPDTGGQYVPAFTVADRAAALKVIGEASYLGDEIVAREPVSTYPDFELYWVRLRFGGDTAFMVPK